MVDMPDINQMRQNYQQALAQQQQQALRGVQDIYGARGTTGSGSEAYGFGQLGQQFGTAAGQQENQLQQYLGGLGMQEAQLAQQGQQFGQNLGEQQRQFNIGQGNTQQQFGLQRQLGLGNLALGQGQLRLQQGAQQFGQNQIIANMYSTGQLSQNPFAQYGQNSQYGQNQQANQGQMYGGGNVQNNPFASLTTEQQQYEQSPEYQFAQQMGFQDPTQMKYAAQFDPTWFKNNAYNKGLFGENMQGGLQERGLPAGVKILGY